MMEGHPLSPRSQEIRTKRMARAERDLADAKRYREQS